jgi:hypothetical protein
VKKLLLLAGATVLMAACSETTTSPQRATRPAPRDLSTADLVCASGYIVAYDENGNAYCAPDPNGHNQGQPTQGSARTP